MKNAIKKLGGFGLSTIITGVVGIIVIPFIITYAGVDAWTSIAVSQAVGALISTFAFYGWGITGPTDVAVLDEEDRGDYYFQSVLSRTWLCALLSVMAGIITAFLVTDYETAAAVIAVSGVLGALSASWFFVGESSPSRLFFLDTLPRVIGILLGLALLAFYGNVLYFAFAQLAGALAAALLSTFNILRRYRGWKLSISPIQALKNLGGQQSQIVITSTAAIYVNMPLILVQIFIPAATTVYALADRIIRLGMVVLRPIIQVTQGWVPDKDRKKLLRKVQIITKFALIFGLVTGSIYTFLSDITGLILSRNEISIAFSLALPLGIAVGAMTATQFIGFAALNALNKTKALAISVTLGAVAMLILLPILIPLMGAQGVALGVAIAEIVVLGYQLIKVAKTENRR